MTSGWKAVLLLATAAVVVAGGLRVFWGGPEAPSSTAAPVPAPAGVKPPVVEASESTVRELCAKCHAYPPPDSFPRDVWRQEIRQAYRFIRDAKIPGPLPDEESVALFYEGRAPQTFSSPRPNPLGDASPVDWIPRSVAYAMPDGRQPAVASLQLVKLNDDGPLELLVCDAESGLVLLYRPHLPDDPWKLLAKLPAPATGCVVDLDSDGIRDLVVADLGRLSPSDERMGKIVWLRGLADGSYQPVTLANGLGRVADVQAADFRGTGKLDLIVGVYGWRAAGDIRLLENQTDDWSAPRFVSRVVDERHGAIHVPVVDLNGDGRPDFVALIAQEHEQVVAFLNEGDGAFGKDLIYRAPHPAYGCSGIALTDINGDGSPDVLLTNGDTLDGPVPIRPYNGVRWLENRGSFPFEEHFLTSLPGAMRALAGDVDDDGDQDVVAVSFLPQEYVDPQQRSQTDSIVLLEQTARGQFERHVLERGLPDHICSVFGDWRGDGKIGLITGNFVLPRAASGPAAERPVITVWENRPAATSGQ